MITDRDNNRENRCPDFAMMKAYLEDSLPRELDLEIEKHLVVCASCNVTIEEILGTNGRAAADKLSLLGIADQLIESKGLSGVEFGKYRLIDCIGEGGMGIVYRAYVPSLDRYCAIKLLSARRLASKTAVERFQREIASLGKLDNPHLVTAYDAGDYEGQVYLAMKYVDGPNAEQLVQHAGQLPLADASDLIRQAADGLAYVHANGLVHRDVKPSNIMVDRMGRVYVTDLGIAKPSDGATRELASIVGTPYFMSPEQRIGKRIDHRSDIYALGRTLERLVGVDEARGREGGDDHHALPQAVRELIDTMCALDADARPASLEQVIEVLEPMASGSKLSTLAETIKIESTYTSVDHVVFPIRDRALVKQPQPEGIVPVEQAVSRRRTRLLATLGVLTLVTLAASVALAMVISRDRGTPVFDRVGRYELLNRQTDWFVEAPDSFRHTEEKRRELRLSSKTVAAVELGKTWAEHYTFSMDIEQHRPGGVSIYFGGQDATDREQAVIVYQFLKLEFSPPRNNPRYFVKRGITIVDRETKEVIRSDWMMSQEVDIEPEKPFEFEVEIVKTAVSNVRFGGANLMDLVGPELDARANTFAIEKNSLTRGSFGVSVMRNEATVTDAILRVHRKPKATSVSP